MDQSRTSRDAPLHGVGPLARGCRTDCRSHAGFVAHDIGLSLGTEGWADTAYLAQVLAAWQRRFQPVWHSDHLSLGRVHGDGGELQGAGVVFPVLYDEELLTMVGARIDEVHARSPLPFLIENNGYFATLPDQDMSEAQFLNALAERTGCGLLLDVHNVYAKARNHGSDPFAFIDALISSVSSKFTSPAAASSETESTDRHSGPCPEVWRLLDHVTPRAPRLCGITFEFHDSYFPALGDSGVRAQLDRARQAWHTARACPSLSSNARTRTWRRHARWAWRRAPGQPQRRRRTMIAR